MKSKCVICNKKDSNTAIKLTQWIIGGGNDAVAGKERNVHATCLSGKLYIEEPEGFVYGRIHLEKDKKKKK